MNDESRIAVFRKMIEVLDVDKEEARLFLRGAVKFLISDDYESREHPGQLTCYTLIIPRMRKAGKDPHLFLGWICQLGRFPGPLNGEWLKIKPAYPAGQVEPVPWRELPATDQRCEVPLEGTSQTAVEFQAQLWQKHLRNVMARVLKYEKAKDPTRSESDILQDMVQKGLNFKQ